MMTSNRAASMIGRLVPNRGAATITLTPDFTPEEVTVSNAWAKPIASRLSDYGHLNLQGDETLLHIPDNELNPTTNGREIRTRDQIVFNGETFQVIISTLKTVRTDWVCVCRKVLN